MPPTQTLHHAVLACNPIGHAFHNLLFSWTTKALAVFKRRTGGFNSIVALKASP